MQAAIEELEKSLKVETRKLEEHQRELERLEEKKPIVKKNIRETEGKVLEIEASLLVLKKLVEVQ